MGKIEFRAWDKLKNKMINWTQITTPLNKVEEGYRFDFFQGVTAHLIPMQYTNFEDKNDKKIYDGDIARVPNLWYGRPDCIPENKGRKYFYYAIEPNKSFCNDCNVGGGWIFPDYPRHIEIVGNIYENPELLEVKDEPEAKG